MVAMKDQPERDACIDRLAAAVLRGERAEWPEAWRDPASQEAVVNRIAYHGVAGLLVEADQALLPWPETVRQSFKSEAVYRTFWEIRHHLVLSDLLNAFSGREIRSTVLKGTALAYDLYERPACRARGDTDLLVDCGQLNEAREILTELGFVRDAAAASHNDEFHLQEVWRFDCPDGTTHPVDLHWQVMNYPALEGVLDTAACMTSSVPLPRLCDTAFTMNRPAMLVHVLLHRAAHVTAPYFSGGSTFYGGDRLIWVQDIGKLAAVFDDDDWHNFVTMARNKGIARVCLDGLTLAHRRLGAKLPDAVAKALTDAPSRQPVSAYLLDSGKLIRRLRDMRAMRGLASMLYYAATRIFPSRAFMRAKYPGLAGLPIAWLYVRRAVDLLRRRPGRSGV